MDARQGEIDAAVDQELAEKQGRLAAAEKAELALRKERRLLEVEKRRLELEVEGRLWESACVTARRLRKKKSRASC